MFSKRKFYLYYNIYFAGLFLILLGSVFVLSSSFSYSLEKNNLTFYFVKHINYLFLGLILVFLIQKIDMKKLEKISTFLFIFSLFFLILPVLQHRLRWAKIGPFLFQPSEFVKLTFILYLASYIKKISVQVNNLKNLILPSISWIIITGILQLQKDLGTFVIITVVFMGILFISGLKMKYILSFSTIFICLIVALILLFPYRIERIKKHGKAYQAKQSVLSLSSGGFFGKGFGAGTRKLRYVPEIHKDFVYAVVGEELGFIGTFGVLILFAILVFCGLEVSKECDDFFEKILCSGISILFGIQFVLHACVVLSIFPTKGTTLPFFSVGGSSLITNLVAFGVLIKISKNIINKFGIKDIEEITIDLK
jgi:cell division protein FtsW